jgi:transcriptional regulator with XRE-family HTH domain
MENYDSIVEKIIKLREQSGLTQEEVAGKLGISRQRWILVEKGERDLSTEELEILAALFGVDTADFFEEIPDIEKFRQMYFACIKFASDARGGVPKTKLAKLLYLADFTKFYKDLEPMSGVKYRRMEFGPVADIFFSTTEDLFDGGKINITPVDQALIISANTREQSFDRLSKDELHLIEEICELWKDKRTAEIVNFTHEQKPWKVCRDGEYIPYSLIIQEEPEHVYKPLAG